MRRFRIALLLALALLAVGVGGGRRPFGQPTAARAQSVVAVSMINNTFAPADIRIPVGATVVWANDDYTSNESHDVSMVGGLFYSPVFGPGGIFEFTFTTAGVFPYYCSLHDGMTGSVTVE